MSYWIWAIDLITSESMSTIGCFKYEYSILALLYNYLAFFNQWDGDLI